MSHQLFLHDLKSSHCYADNKSINAKDTKRQSYRVGQTVSFLYPSHLGEKTDEKKYTVTSGVIDKLYDDTVRILLLPEKKLWWKGPYSSIIPDNDPDNHMMNGNTDESDDETETHLDNAKSLNGRKIKPTFTKEHLEKLVQARENKRK